MAAFVTLGFGADLFDKLFGDFTEGMLDQRQALFMSVLLFVINFVSPLQRGIVVGGLE